MEMAMLVLILLQLVGVCVFAAPSLPKWGADIIPPRSYRRFDMKNTIFGWYYNNSHQHHHHRPDGDVDLLLFHGCNHNGEDWFKLPEETRFLDVALKLGFGHIVAMSSPTPERSGCWPTDFDNNDHMLQAVRNAIVEPDMLPSLLKPHVPVENAQFAKRRRICIGGSSGGSFVGQLAVKFPDLCDGIGFYIAQGIPSLDFAPRLRNIPVAFVQMPRDKYLTSIIAKVAELLRKFTKVKVWDVHPAAVSRLVPESILEPLRKQYVLDKKNFLIQDPRLYEENLKDGVGDTTKNSGQNLTGAGLQELLNRAYATHEFCHDFAEEVLKFLLLESASSSSSSPHHPDL